MSTTRNHIKDNENKDNNTFIKSEYIAFGIITSSVIILIATIVSIECIRNDRKAKEKEVTEYKEQNINEFYENYVDHGIWL